MLMKKRVVVFTTLACAILFAAGIVGIAIFRHHNFRPDVSAQVWKPTIVSEDEIISLVNVQRAAVGVSALSENKLLDASAATKCQDMIAQNYYDHISPNGAQSWNFIENAGYRYSYEGENLAEEFWDGINAVQIIDGWMNSPAHKQAMLNSNYKDTGFAFCNDPTHQRAFAVEHFGSQR